MEPILDYLRTVRGATRFQHLREAAISYFLQTPVKMMSYVHCPPVGGRQFNADFHVASFGYPDEWIELYHERRYYECDVMARKAQTTVYPFFWREALSLPDLSEREREYVEAAQEMNLGVGITIPVFGPLGHNGYCGMGFGTEGYVPDDRMIAELQMAGQIGHLAFCDLLMRRSPTEISLSKREKEILKLMAHGQTNTEIAETLSISANTVHTYVKRCFDKLGVTDRVTAALRGMALGVMD